MALIWRAVFETDDTTVFDRVPNLLRDWGSFKVRDPEFQLPEPNTPIDETAPVQFRVDAAGTDNVEIWRATCFEQEPRPGEQVRTQFTTFRASSRRWIWIDVENWKDEAFRPTWLPHAPRLSRDALRLFGGRRGETALHAQPQSYDGEQGRDLAEMVAARARQIPIVVVSPTPQELSAQDFGATDARASAIFGRLAGIAQVAVLGTGAVTSFSSRMAELMDDPDYDVHSGAIRTYLPFGSETGPSRHRFVPFHRLKDRDVDGIAGQVAPALLRAACAQMPPPRWRALGAPLLDGGTPDAAATSTDGTSQELLADLLDAEEKIGQLREEKDEIELQLLGAHEEQVEAIKAAAKLQQRCARLMKKLAEQGVYQGDLAEEAVEESPTDCVTVLSRATAEFPLLALGPKTLEGAQELDAQNNEVWAAKSWQALKTLAAYIEAKSGGFVGNFHSYIQAGEGLVIPATQLAMKESKTTDQNQKFRALRTFPVPVALNDKGEIYMPAHIKLQQGGTTAPRIHFYDDTGGATKKVHIGWLGPHLENKGKN